MADEPQIKRALLSAYDKRGLAELGKTLASANVELIASGGTAACLQETGLAVTPLENVSGNPEAFSGRVKTLSFNVAASLLFRRDSSEDLREARQLELSPIDLVVCNFYPFRQAAERGADWAELVEFIDIGGPTLLRAAAKNCQAVSILCAPDQYAEFKNLFASGEGKIEESTRRMWAARAFHYSAAYEATINRELSKRLDIPPGRPLRYGENPHQRAWVVTEAQNPEGLAGITPLQGKALSYNNFLDADAALACVGDLDHLSQNGSLSQAAVVIKHGNPCGMSLATDPLQALKLAWAGDPMSAFGSIVALNFPVDEAVASWFLERFVEVILAPQFTPAARELFKAKKNLRLLEQRPSSNTRLLERSIGGGKLIQEEDSAFGEELNWVTKKRPFEGPTPLLFHFGIIAAKHLKSNAIALVAPCESSAQLIGAGMGNPNRLESIDQAALKARQNGWQDLKDAVLVSDAFFPFKDSIERAHRYGIDKIVQPGGGKRESEVIDCCDQLGISMALTGRRHFRH